MYTVSNRLKIGSIILMALGIIGIGIGFMSAPSDIAEAKELPVPPPPDVTRMEFDMKDQMIRQTIITTQEDVQEIKKSIEKIEDKLFNR